ncbi:MAG: hypothetical protein ACRDS9_00390 [Pseudonocardiaceae bacterium]
MIAVDAICAAMSGPGRSWPLPSSPEINGCVGKQTGILRVIDPAKGQKCLKFETPLSWNKAGKPGPGRTCGPAGDLSGVHDVLRTGSSRPWRCT